MLATGLRQVDGMAKNVFDIVRHRIQIALGGTDPFDGFAGLLRHRLNYVCLGIIPSIRRGGPFSGTRVLFRAVISAYDATLGRPHTATTAETIKNYPHIG